MAQIFAPTAESTGALPPQAGEIVEPNKAKEQAGWLKVKNSNLSTARKRE